MNAAWYLYLVRCKNGALYTGITTDVGSRFATHRAQGKQCAKYLRGKGPLHLVYAAEAGSRSRALRLERAVKRLSKTDKERIVRGEATLPEVKN